MTPSLQVKILQYIGTISADRGLHVQKMAQKYPEDFNMNDS